MNCGDWETDGDGGGGCRAGLSGGAAAIPIVCGNSVGWMAVVGAAVAPGCAAARAAFYDCCAGARWAGRAVRLRGLLSMIVTKSLMGRPLLLSRRTSPMQK